MRWIDWRAGILAGVALAVVALSQTTPPQQPPKAPSTPAQAAPAQPPAQQTPTPPAPAQQTPPADQQPAPTQPSANPPTPPATETPAAPRPTPPPSRLAIVLDAAHGGDERGAALTDKLQEKDVTLSLARRVRAELGRAGVPVTMLRDADVTLDEDQRAQMANGSRPLLYVTIHASSAGSGVRIFTAILPELQPAPGSFVRWQRAQQEWLDPSHAAAESVAADLGDQQIAASTLSAPIPPLNSVTAAALAIEVAPPPGGRATADMLGSAQYQQRVASALAAALVNARRKLGGSQ